MNISMNSMIANTLFGSKSSISAGSFLSASNFGDLSLMRSGVYTKMLKSYYAKQHLRQIRRAVPVRTVHPKII